MAKTGHPNINLRYTAPWRGIDKIWSLQFNYSGVTLSTDQQLAFAQAVHNDVVSTFFSQNAVGQYLSGWSSYDGVNSAALQEDDYGSADDSLAAGWNGHADYGTSYEEGFDVAVSGLESCCVLFAPLGLNSTGKPFFMRKFIHGCPGSATGSDAFSFSDTAASAAAKLGDGSLPGTRVLCTDKGAQGSWEAQSFIGNHQLFRKYVKKSVSVLDTLLKGADLAQKASLLAYLASE